MNRKPEDVADEWLVLRCQEGSARAVEELLRRWRKWLWLHAVRVTGDEEAAEDVVQESLLAIVQGIRRLDDPSRFRAWAYRIVTFKGRDWIRRRIRQRKLEDDVEQEQCGGRDSEPESRTSDLREAFERLPASQRDLLRLHYHLGLSLQEIATVEDIPVGTVKSRLHQARQHLKQQIQTIEQ